MKALLAAVLLALAASPADAAAPVRLCSAGIPGDRQAGFDDDRDGVPGSDDWCVDTPAGTPVGSNGCADWEVPARCEREAPPPAPKAPAAPPADADGDGVADASDLCAGTPAGTAVTANGCADIGKVVLKGVSFALGSATLLPEAVGTLRTVATAMKANPGVIVEVGGHTDSIGDARGNQRLSQRRAESVRRFLVGEGVEAERLSPTGYGETRPVDDNQTPAGRANNRRVEFKVIRGG